ncbi:RagB/SusD family nutrient uptake outer membrane protein [uncultured Bacteroides sp.]|uniref:RagB/SusD family nutrient uptake outer membrane protein n=1 Tax=uncultured Bacteroides sp. TaxID=162156 RepID=UPI0025DBB0F5|nr:RagB/SusD family nutrient uptake outer membrane protein [uncultured Bacteroides sp.]
MKIRNIFMAALLGATLHSCEFLDVVPDDTSTLDDAFKTETSAGNFIYGCYSVMPEFLNFRDNEAWSTTPEIIGSPHWTTEWFYYLIIQRSNHSPAYGGSALWRNMYGGIRNCWIFLDNIDKTVPVKWSQDEFEKNKRQWIGEAYFLIGYYHFCLMQAYGPVVISDKLLESDAPAQEMMQARRPIDECVERIAGFFDKAMEYLPDSYNDSNLGRGTTIIAQALKARLYLYAASPLYNGNTDYADFKNKAEYGGEQLVPTTYDAEKWKRALDQYEIAINAAVAKGFKLYEYTGNTARLSDFDKAIANSRYKIAAGWDSPELIWPYTGTKETIGYGNGFSRHAILHGITNETAPIGGLGTTLWTARLYLTKNGREIDKDPNYDYANSMKVDDDEVLRLNKNREPRFYADLGYDRGPYEISNANGLDTITIKMRFQGKKGGEYHPEELHGARDNASDQLYGGYAVKKMINPRTTIQDGNNNVAAYPFPIIRLAELYLGYAEAYVNYYRKLDGDGAKYFNLVRKRAGLGTIAETHPNATPEELIEAVRREKTVEFMFEGQMFWDYRRWKIAKEAWKGMEEGMPALNVYGFTPEDYNKEVKADKMPFVFKEEGYLYPIQQEYLNKNPKLVQNPNW